MAMDFCSRHSFDKAPLPPSKKNSMPSGNGERKRPFMSEEEQLQAAVEASLKQGHGSDNKDDDEDAYAMEEGEDDESDDDVVCLSSNEDMMTSICTETGIAHDQHEIAPTFIEVLLAIEVGEEPANGARVQLRMPDATRLVRTFMDSESVKSIYAFVAVSQLNFPILPVVELGYTVTDYSRHSKTTIWLGRERSSCSWQAFHRRISKQKWRILLIHVDFMAKQSLSVGRIKYLH